VRRSLVSHCNTVHMADRLAHILHGHHYYSVRRCVVRVEGEPLGCVTSRTRNADAQTAKQPLRTSCRCNNASSAHVSERCRRSD
jgi:hypothetical protein